MRYYLYMLFSAWSMFSLAQVQDNLSETIDNKYREDQFYASITYNLLVNNPERVSQSDFSTGFHFGFIRDMPFNQKRNWAIGLGLGVSSNSYNQDLYITQDSGTISFSTDATNLGNVTKNKFTTYLIDVPVELRWRTSNPEKFKFWRIYSGFKFSYLVYNSTKLRSSLQDVKLSNLDVFNRLQCGLTLSAGYGTWNFNLYYGLNSIFYESTQIDGQTIDSRAVKVGIMFYIL
ncbi:MAG: PorT family protein [Winogradskyella sp.]|uniref:porin family protein n=1 Tax=Winogradskyella sp. TaxID=1883156 RepID=UPI0017B2F4B9|nr:porin family protein [Winogradskyella sp.]MBT8244949.1 PorT family protein [Winogradskyella sp.]NNK22209.1 PorT family protein [Winogradskyella sp.]